MKGDFDVKTMWQMLVLCITCTSNIHLVQGLGKYKHLTESKGFNLSMNMKLTHLTYNCMSWVIKHDRNKVSVLVLKNGSQVLVLVVVPKLFLYLNTVHFITFRNDVLPVLFSPTKKFISSKLITSCLNPL